MAKSLPSWASPKARILPSACKAMSLICEWNDGTAVVAMPSPPPKLVSRLPSLL